MNKKSREKMKKILVYVIAFMMIVGILPMLFGR